MGETQNKTEAGPALTPLFRKPSYSPAETASILTASLGKVYRLIQRGDLKAVKIGASLRINRSELTRYLVATGLEVEAGQ